MTRTVYLHGFASGPGSKKARYFKERLAEEGVPLSIPDLSGGDFAHLTLTGQLAVIRREVSSGRVRLLGSSMGGYLAALYAAAHPREVERLVLMAPAFDFAARWRARLGEPAFEEWKRSGSLTVFHYGEGASAGVGFELYTDALRYPAFPVVTQPCLVFQGLRDEVVPAHLSERFASLCSNVTLRLLDSDHELLDVTGLIWNETWAFFQA